MGDIALQSVKDEDLLYQLFGINAEILIDHAWGYEPATIEGIKNYRPAGKSLGAGQVLSEPYDFKKGKLIVKEMTDALALDLCDKGLVTNQIVLTIGYDVENLINKDISSHYKGEVTIDYLGRKVPKHAHGTFNLDRYTSSSKALTDAVVKLYDKIVNKSLYVRRINVTATSIKSEKESATKPIYKQLSLFGDLDLEEAKIQSEIQEDEKEKKSQKAILEIKKKYGKNAVMKGMNLQEGATMKERNKQIGGHKA